MYLEYEGRRKKTCLKEEKKKKEEKKEGKSIVYIFCVSYNEKTIRKTLL